MDERKIIRSFICSFIVVATVTNGQVEDPGMIAAKQTAKKADDFVQSFCDGAELKINVNEKSFAPPPGAKKTCEEKWNPDGTGIDAACRKYPDFCQVMPPPPSSVFAAFTEPFPCFSLKPCFIGKVAEKKKQAKSTPMKCMFDLALCFFQA